MSLSSLRGRCLRGVAAVALATLASAHAGEDPRQFVQFVEEPAGHCVLRGGVQILVKSSHPNRRIRVWLDRHVGGVGTGDRSRSELDPGAEAEALGCSRNSDVAQEWRIVRAEFID